MPNTHETLEDLFTDCANAIMEKDGTSSPIVADLFPEKIRAIPQGGGDITVEPLPVSANGTYTAPSGKAYSPVVVNVPQGVFPSGTRNISANGNYDVTNYASVAVSVPAGGIPSPITAGDFPVLVNTNSYTCTMTDSAEQTIHATGLKIKVPKAGTYRFKWSASKQTDGTSRKDGSTRLYKNGTAVGSLHTVVLGETDTPAFTEDIACSANDEIEIWIAAGTWTFGLLGTYSGGGAYGFCACINWNPWN